ncbi:MAG: Integrase [Gemmatimonadetes bacterium]|nr:Integrase [Gemmatimonadota bacterium]
MSPKPKAARRALRIEIQSKVLQGGRLSISARTDTARERKEREAALRLCLKRGDVVLVEAVRSGGLRIEELTRAVADRSGVALDALRAAQADQQSLDGGPMMDLSLGAMGEYVLRLKTANQELGTSDIYATYIRRLVAEFGADRPLRDVGIMEAQAWLHQPRKGGKAWAANTQAAALNVAGYVWRTAIALEADEAERHSRPARLTRSPWAGVETASVRTTRHSFLEPPEWTALAASEEGSPRALLLALGCLAGLRAGEALSLRPGLDVDLDARLLRIQPREGEYRWKPKHEHSIRTLPIRDRLYSILRRHIDAGYAGDRYLIRLPKRDRPLSQDTLAAWTQVSYGRVGLKYGREGEALTFHSLRHTFASWLVREDVSLKKVALLMGNTVSEVERTYAHVMDHDLSRAAGVIDRLVAG